MSRSKKIFVASAIVFMALLGYVVYDISSRTTFPGSRSKPDRTESPAADTLAADSAHVNQQ